MSGYLLNGKLRAAWRAPFEASYGQSFAHVRAHAGPEADCRLAALGVLALAVNEETIFFSERLREMSETAQLAIVGHELAHTVQLARGGSDSREALEAEAWRAAWAALRGERCEIRCGARQESPLAAVALVMDAHGSNYFKIFDTLASLKVTIIELIKPLTYEKMLDIMLDTKMAKEKDFVIQAHGTQFGFLIPITQVTNKNDTVSKPKNAQTNLLRQLRLLAELIKEYKEAGDDLQKLKDIVNKKSLPPVSDVASAKAAIEREIGRQKVMVGLDSVDDILRIVKKMDAVKAIQR
ncbi:MAG: DUF4157 domain-containing protein, partial [Pyrinomonadaceae bacterium]|nr:DUF4157 domain-containing protein [Pyrinomonadaceae bacterium]